MLNLSNLVPVSSQVRKDGVTKSAEKNSSSGESKAHFHIIYQGVDKKVKDKDGVETTIRKGVFTISRKYGKTLKIFSPNKDYQGITYGFAILAPIKADLNSCKEVALQLLPDTTSTVRILSEAKETKVAETDTFVKGKKSNVFSSNVLERILANQGIIKLLQEEKVNLTLDKIEGTDNIFVVRVMTNQEIEALSTSAVQMEIKFENEPVIQGNEVNANREGTSLIDDEREIDNDISFEEYEEDEEDDDLE